MKQFVVPSTMSSAREFRAYPRAAQSADERRDRRSTLIVAAIACCVCVTIGVGVALGYALSPSTPVPLCCQCDACGDSNTTLSVCGEATSKKASHVAEACAAICGENECAVVASSTALDADCDSTTCEGFIATTTTTTTTGITNAIVGTTIQSASSTRAPVGAAVVSDGQSAIALDFVCSVPFAHNSSVVSFFAYRVPRTLTLPIGAANHVSPGPDARGQPEQFFAPGGTVALTWNRVAHTHIEWTLVVDASTTVRARAVARTAPCPALA